MPFCGEYVGNQSFCPNCGRSMGKTYILTKQEKKDLYLEPNENETNIGLNQTCLFTAFQNNSFEPIVQSTTISDENLTILAEYSIQQYGTVNANEYKSLVLYKRSEEEYEVHSYTKDERMTEVLHKAYTAEKEIWEEICQYVQTNKTEELENSRGISLMGERESFRYFNGERMVLVSSDNPDEKAYSLFRDIFTIFHKVMTENREI